MINRFIHFSLQHRFLVLLMAILLCGLGFYSAAHLPMDAMPDITSLQIQINVASGAMAPEEIEKQVAVPIERAMTGLPGLQLMRSLSRFGLSQITLIFDDESEVYKLRQLIGERLQSISSQLPPGVQPILQPVSSGLGEIFYYGIEFKPPNLGKAMDRKQQLMEMKTLQDWYIAPLVMQVRGVAEVSTSGGFDKEILVRPDPEKLHSMGSSLDDLASVIGRNTENAGGGVYQTAGEQVIIRSVGRVQTVEDIRNLPLRYGSGAQPVLIKDVAEVSVGSSPRTGAAMENGEETVIGAAIMLRGENTRTVTQRVKEKLQEIQAELPAGYKIHSLYDRGYLVNLTIRTVEKNLFEGALLVMTILFVFLGNWRAALIVTAAIPLSLLFAITGMVQTKLTGNLMSLGAIDFGLIVDGAVVITENVVRHLRAKQTTCTRPLSLEERMGAIISACKEVSQPMMVGVGIITLVYIPIFALGGIEGKMFKPMASTVVMAMSGALLFGLTLVPVLCFYFLKSRPGQQTNPLIRTLRFYYQPMLSWAFRHVGLLIGGGLLLVAIAGIVSSKLGAEFVPNLDEGSSLLAITRTPSIGLDASLAMQSQTEKLLRAKFTEIQNTFSRVGADDKAVDPVGIYRSDTYLNMLPREQWREKNGHKVNKEELVEMMDHELAENIPGQSISFSQPIEDRFNDFFEGARADVAIKIFGEDFEILQKLANQIKGILETVPGHADSTYEAFGKAPILEVIPDRAALRKFNLQVDDINRVVSLGLGGTPLGRVIEGDRPIDVILRFPEEARADLNKLQGFPIRLGDGGFIPLGQLAECRMTEAVNEIHRDSGRRHATVTVNIRGRDLASFVHEVREKVTTQVKLPEGYLIEFGGQFKNLESAGSRLLVVGPMVLGLILWLVYWAFGSWRQVLLICTGIPLAMTGGIFALLFRGMPLSISAAIGFIALSGVAVLNGIVLISYFNQLRGDGKSVSDAAMEGALIRLSPVLMTALVASLGFLPMALARGVGAEVQRPLATVVIGGILTSTFLTLVLLPSLYARFGSRENGPSMQV